MKISEHNRLNKEKFGKEFEGVNIFLDQFKKDETDNHRLFHHHTFGVEIVKFLFGEEAGKVAAFHIKCDLGKVLKPKQLLKEFKKNKQNQEQEKIDNEKIVMERLESLGYLD